MSRKKIELTEQVERLVKKYLEVTDTSLDDLANKALKSYLADHLSSGQIKDALKETEDANSQYTGKLFQNGIDDLNKY